jgi:hypothetical protein
MSVSIINPPPPSAEQSALLLWTSVGTFGFLGFDALLPELVRRESLSNLSSLLLRL